MAELDSSSKPIQLVYSWYADGKLAVNRRYQRKLVWTLFEKQKLIESVLAGYPIPAILLAERDGGGYEVIDGLQRLHTLMSYIETAFPRAEGGLYFNVEEFASANRRAAEGIFEVTSETNLLRPTEVVRFLDYPLSISIMRGASETDVNEVFSRINTYGHRLSDQERRQAGAQDAFSNLIRELACDLRGDASSDLLDLSQMPSISIDLPKTKHGYAVEADKVFWVEHGILLSTGLRDSEDEQCLADIVGSIVGGDFLERSKSKLDEIYDEGSEENVRVLAALEVYGSERVKQEVKYCVQEIRKICGAGGVDSKLRSILFSQGTTNAFSAVFAVLLLAMHEALVKDGRMVGDYAGARDSLRGIHDRLETSRKSTQSSRRRANADQIKGLLHRHLVASEAPNIYTNNSVMDIDALISRSHIEKSDYELKQGMLRLESNGNIDDAHVAKIMQTLCAIANNGPGRSGCVIIGVCDRDEHAERIRVIDGITTREVGRRKVCGIDREAKRLGLSLEDYVGKWKVAIQSSGLSDALKASVLSSMDYNSYFGLGVLLLRIPPQSGISYCDGNVYKRHHDETRIVKDASSIVEIARRFGG